MSAVAVHCVAAVLHDAALVAARLHVPVHPIEVHRFPDGELRVTADRAAATAILYMPLDQPNDKLVTLLLAADALRRGGARRLVLVAPYLCYMRQDAAFRPGEAISQKVIGALIARTVDRVVTVDAHLHRTKTIAEVFPGIEAQDLSAMPAIADALRGSLASGTIVVGPDEESKPWVSDLAGRLAVECTVGRKIRHSDRSVDISFDPALRLEGRSVLLADDMVSSGGTLVACAKALAVAGAASIDAVIVHALFPPEGASEFAQAGIGSIRSANSVPHPTNAILLDGILAAALQQEVVRAGAGP